MKHKNGSACYLFLILFCLLAIPQFQTAEGYGSFFKYDINRMKEVVLIDAAGVISISDKEKVLKIYELKDNHFVQSGSLQLNKTMPVSQGGYGGWVQYYVTHFRGDFVQIVVDPYQDLRAWIRPENSNLLTIVKYDDPQNAKIIFQFEINIFLTSDTVGLYASPGEKSPTQILKKSELKRTVFYPAGVKDGYIQIGKRFFNENFTGKGSDEDECRICESDPIGWIKARDSRGRISFFFYVYTWD